jgi:hypothetical protein
VFQIAKYEKKKKKKKKRKIENGGHFRFGCLMNISRPLCVLEKKFLSKKCSKSQSTEGKKNEKYDMAGNI